MKKIILLLIFVLVTPLLTACDGNSNNKYYGLINALSETQELNLRDNNYQNDFVMIKGIIRMDSHSFRSDECEYQAKLIQLIIVNNAIYIADSEDAKYFLFYEIDWIKCDGVIIWQK